MDVRESRRLSGTSGARLRARARRAAVMALATLALGAVALPAARAAGEDDVNVRVNARGATVEVDVEFTVDVPAQDAWRVLTDYDRMAKFVPTLESSRIVGGSGTHLEVEQHWRVRHGVVAYASQNVREVTLEPYREIRTRLLRGDLEASESVTRLEPHGHGVRVVNHGVHVVRTLVPGGVISHFVEADTRRQFAGLRDEIVRRRQKMAHAGN